jgi:hypothetical protein
MQSYGPFYLSAKTIPGTVYLKMAESFLILKIFNDNAQRSEVCQQGDVPSHSHAGMRDFLELQFSMSHFGPSVALLE